jgi:hypothetical protein
MARQDPTQRISRSGDESFPAMLDSRALPQRPCWPPPSGQEERAGNGHDPTQQSRRIQPAQQPETCAAGDGGETSRQPGVHPEPGQRQEQGKPIGHVQPSITPRPLEPDQQPDHRRQNQTIDADLGLRLPCRVVPPCLQRPPNTRTQVSQRSGAHRGCPIGSGLDPTLP